MSNGIIIRDNITGKDTFLPVITGGLVLMSDPSNSLGFKFTSGVSRSSREQTWSFNTLNFSSSRLSGQVIAEMFIESGTGLTAKLIKARTSYRDNIIQGTAAFP